MHNYELIQQREEERISWRDHRREEARAAEQQWLEHVDANRDRRASSDPARIQDGLIVDGLLFPLSMRPTLRLDDAARAAIEDPSRAWSPEEFFAQFDEAA